MKHKSLEPLKEWFGYTRRERRASFFLLLMIIAVAGIRFIVPNRKINIEILQMEDSLTLADSSPVNDTLSQDQKSQPGRVSRPSSVVDINKCDSAALEALPGIGPVLSARIIKYRNLLGGYADISQLKEVYGLPEETFDLISARVKANPSEVRKMSINTAEYKQLIRLPYFERYEVSAILKYRELKGKIEGIEELVENGIISEDKVQKVKFYLDFTE